MNDKNMYQTIDLDQTNPYQVPRDEYFEPSQDAIYQTISEPTPREPMSEQKEAVDQRRRSITNRKQLAASKVRQIRRSSSIQSMKRANSAYSHARLRKPKIKQQDMGAQQRSFSLGNDLYNVPDQMSDQKKQYVISQIQKNNRSMAGLNYPPQVEKFASLPTRYQWHAIYQRPQSTHSASRMSPQKFARAGKSATRSEQKEGMQPDRAFVVTGSRASHHVKSIDSAEWARRNPQFGKKKISQREKPVTLNPLESQLSTVNVQIFAVSKSGENTIQGNHQINNSDEECKDSKIYGNIEQAVKAQATPQQVLSLKPIFSKRSDRTSVADVKSEDHEISPRNSMYRQHKASQPELEVSELKAKLHTDAERSTQNLQLKYTNCIQDVGANISVEETNVKQDTASKFLGHETIDHDQEPEHTSDRREDAKEITPKEIREYIEDSLQSLQDKIKEESISTSVIQSGRRQLSPQRNVSIDQAEEQLQDGFVHRKSAGEIQMIDQFEEIKQVQMTDNQQHLKRKKQEQKITEVFDESGSSSSSVQMTQEPKLSQKSLLEDQDHPMDFSRTNSDQEREKSKDEIQLPDALNIFKVQQQQNNTSHNIANSNSSFLMSSDESIFLSSRDRDKKPESTRELKIVKMSKSTSIYDWLKSPLNQKEIMQARRRIDDMYPLKDLPLESLFTSVQIFNDLKARFCGRCARKKATSEHKVDASQNLPQNRLAKQKNIIKSGDLLLNQMIQRAKTNQGLQEHVSEEVARENHQLDAFLKAMDAKYVGTDPIKDSKLLHYIKNFKQQRITDMMKSKKASSASKLEKDPFEVFGHGIQSYFLMMRALIYAFAALTVLFLPTVVIYSNGSAYSAYESAMDRLWVTPTLGNLGHAQTHCHSQFLRFDRKMDVKCQAGKISNLRYMGIVPKVKQDAAHKIGDVHHDFCGDPDEDPQVKKCSKLHLNHAQLKTDFEKTCGGKTRCEFNLVEYYSANRSGLKMGTVACISEFTNIYVQFDCDFAEDLPWFRNVGLFVTIQAIMACLIIYYTTFYLRKIADMNYKVWDVQMDTSSDFTVQVTLPERLWAKWLTLKSEAEFQEKHVKEQFGIKSHLFKSFKEFLKARVEHQVQALPPVLRDNEDTQIKIGAIFFAYDNPDLLEALKDRGQKLSNGRFKQNKKIEERIREKIEDNKEQYIRPVTAFIMFESQEGQERCETHFGAQMNVFGRLSSNESGKALEILNEKLEVIRAPEPSNVVWENLHMIPRRIFKNNVLVMAAIAVFLGMVFAIITFLKVQNVKTVSRYPPLTQCGPISKQFADKEEFKRFALDDKGYTLTAHGLGVYQCYCKQYSTVRSIFEENDMCSQYHTDKSLAVITGGTTSILIVAINIVLKFINIALIKKIGYKINGDITQKICMQIFISQFMNTGLILLLANANLKDTPLNFLNIEEGQHSDFNQDWYLDFVPKLVQTMLIQAVMPFIQLAITKTTLSVKRFYDRESFSENFETKKVTIQQYVNLYAGPEAELHVKYSAIMNSVFISFAYGLIVPVLFPITLFALINLYITEQYQFAYIYRKPPMFGNRLNDGALSVIQNSTIMMLLFGYWQLGNRQMFFNQISSINYQTDIIDPQHKLFQYENGINHTVIFLIWLPIFIFFRYKIRMIQLFAYYSKIWENKMDFEIIAQDVDENLGNYWKIIPGVDQKRWYTKEMHLQQNLNIKTMDDKNLEMLRTCKRGPKYLMNIYNYDILSNYRYCDEFFYMQMDKRVEHESSDFVAKVLYLGEDRVNDGECGFDRGDQTPSLQSSKASGESNTSEFESSSKSESSSNERVPSTPSILNLRPKKLPRARKS